MNKPVDIRKHTGDHHRDLNNHLFRYVFFSTLHLRREWFLPILRQLENTQYMPPEDLLALQDQKLRALIQHARANTLYYAEVLPEGVQGLADLQSLPILDKETLRARAKDMTWRTRSGQRPKTSGGSTGAPVTLVKDRKGMAQELAAMWRGYGWAGVQFGDRQARFWGVPANSRARFRASLIDFVCNRHRTTAFNYDENLLRTAYAQVCNFKPNYFYGYVSVMRDLAHFVNQAGYTDVVQPNSIITTSEVLTSLDRQLLERVFKTRVFDEYGCGEIGTIAHECEHGRLHINSENVIIEVLDSSDRPLPPNNKGELVVTDLTNYSMPLIRYRLKDYGAISNRQCPCGRTLQIIDQVYGREYDTLINRIGRNFHGEFFLYILEDASANGLATSGVQFLQHPDLTLEIFLVCEESAFIPLSEYIKKRLKRDFDQQVNIDFHRADQINREPSGKLRVVKKLVR